MKVILTVITVSVLFSSAVFAEQTDHNAPAADRCLFVEDLYENDAPYMVCAFLEMEPIPDNDPEQGLFFYVIHSDQTKQQVLNAFLPELQKYHKHSKLPFSQVADYWIDAFDVPVQIYVFGKNETHKEAFYTSPACRNIIAKAHLLDLGYLGNGALSIAEHDIKSILNVPPDLVFITSIFLDPIEDHTITRAQP